MPDDTRSSGRAGLTFVRELNVDGKQGAGAKAEEGVAGPEGGGPASRLEQREHAASALMTAQAGPRSFKQVLVVLAAVATSCAAALYML